MPLTKYNNNSLSSLTALPAAIPTGKLKFISSQTASNSASISFTTGLSSTYKIYKFVFSNIHARTDEVGFEFNLSTDSGSNYNVTKTTTFFNGEHNENDAVARLEYRTDKDLAQSTSNQVINFSMGFDSDQSSSGELYLFNPASTTYVKHFLIRTSIVADSDYERDAFVAGYGNTTSAVNAIRFQMSSGNMDGTIYLYAIEN